MAYSILAAQSTVFGNDRVWHGVVSADAVSGVVSFGLGNIYQVNWAAKSMASTGIRVRINALSSGTASVGDLGISGATSGDDIYVTIFGR